VISGDKDFDIRFPAHSNCSLPRPSIVSDSLYFSNYCGSVFVRQLYIIMRIPNLKRDKFILIIRIGRKGEWVSALLCWNFGGQGGVERGWA